MALVHGYFHLVYYFFCVFYEAVVEDPADDLLLIRAFFTAMRWRPRGGQVGHGVGQGHFRRGR